jgi:hypothetical protein
MAAALRAGTLTRAGVAREVTASVKRATKRWPRRSTGLERAHKAADAVFASAATKGTRLLDVEKNQRVARAVDAAESLLALEDLRTFRRPTSRAPNVQAASRHRVSWAARRLLASAPLQEAIAKSERADEKSGMAAAAAALREPFDLTPRALGKALEGLFDDPHGAACLDRWIARLEKKR